MFKMDEAPVTLNWNIFCFAGELREGKEDGKSCNSDDALQQENLQQREFPVDQVCRQVPP